jgi:hypothetical protein
MEPADAGTALAAILDELFLPASAWIVRQGHRKGAAAVLDDLDDAGTRSQLLANAVTYWGIGDDQHAAGAVVAYRAARQIGGA